MDMSGHGGLVAGRVSPADSARSACGAFALPIAALLASALLIQLGPALPDFLSPLQLYGPYLTLGIGLMISLAFKRSRALFAILSLLLAYAGFRLFLAHLPQDFPARTVYAGLCLFVPLNLALLSVVRERGALNTYGARRLVLLLLEIGATAAIVDGGYRQLTDLLYPPLSAGAPIAPALAVAVTCAVARGSVLEAAFAVSIAAFAAACYAVGTDTAYAWLAAAGVIVTIGVLQDSYRMAFRDELTGLPGRRALNERLMALDGHYSIAMIDVDHFKRFNDSWGHEVGDQALKLVASRLQRVGGGGRAFRFGGEEFAIVFPGLRPAAVVPQVEALRRDIEAYRLELRARSRVLRRAGDGAPHRVSLTVSVGVAGTSDRLAAPAAVMRAADEALYRAKSGGRNRVGR